MLGWRQMGEMEKGTQSMEREREREKAPTVMTR